ncbi:MAG: NAD(P)H-binding protein [Candidatus Alcyoniella australis]|nr:NAD(P)H-binding protein [Candidatus Alcyoniella australis]
MNKTAFIAGATAYTTRYVLEQPSDVQFRLWLRPDSPHFERFKDDPRVVIAASDDQKALADAMRGCQAVLSLIGTLRSRFKAENVNYESVDFGVNRAMIDAAVRAGIEHFLLMSSAGASPRGGAYLAAKYRAEQHLIASGLPHTIFRPAYLLGGERRFVPGVGALMAALGKLPGLGVLMDDWRPIPLEVLAWNYLRLIEYGPVNGVLRGRDLWQASRAALTKPGE